MEDQSSESSQPVSVSHTLGASDENKNSSSTIPFISSLLMHGKTHLNAIQKGKANFKNVLRALDADYRDLLVNAKNTEYVRLKLQLIENELIKRLKPINSTKNLNKPEKLQKQKEVIENFLPYVGYMGLNNVLREVLLPIVETNVKYLTVLICYAVKKHIMAHPTDLGVELNQHLYPWLSLTSIHEDNEEDSFEVPHVINLMQHCLLDPILENSRDQLRNELYGYLTNQLGGNVEPRYFEEIIFISAENYDVETLQFVVDWMQSFKNDMAFKKKIEKYEDVLRYRLYKSLQKPSSADKTEKLCIHIYAQLNMDLDFLHPYHAIYKSECRGILLSPLHMLTIDRDRVIYDLFIEKIKDLNPKTKLTNRKYDIPSAPDQRNLMVIDDDNITPLHLASFLNKLDLVQDLVRRGADIESVTRDDYSPMLVADKLQHFAIVSVLIEALDAKYPNENDVEKKTIYMATHASQCLNFYKSYLEKTNAISASDDKKQLDEKDEKDEEEEADSPLKTFFQHNWTVDKPKIDLLKKYLTKVSASFDKETCIVSTYQITHSANHPLFIKAQKETLFKAADFESILLSLEHVELPSLIHAIYHFVKSKYVKTIDRKPSVPTRNSATASTVTSGSVAMSAVIVSPRLKATETRQVAAVPAVTTPKASTVKSVIEADLTDAEQSRVISAQTKKVLDNIESKKKQKENSNKKHNEKDIQQKTKEKKVSLTVKTKSDKNNQLSVEAKSIPSRRAQSIIFVPMAKKVDESVILASPESSAQTSVRTPLYVEILDDDSEGAITMLPESVATENEAQACAVEATPVSLVSPVNSSSSKWVIQALLENNIPIARSSNGIEISQQGEESNLEMRETPSPLSPISPMPSIRLSFLNAPVFVPRTTSETINTSIVYDAGDAALSENSEELDLLEGKNLAEQSLRFLNL